MIKTKLFYVATIVLIAVCGFWLIGPKHYYIREYPNRGVNLLFNDNEAFIVARVEYFGVAGSYARIILRSLSPFHSTTPDDQRVDVVVFHLKEDQLGRFVMRAAEGGIAYPYEGSFYLETGLEKTTRLFRWANTNFVVVNGAAADAILNSVGKTSERVRLEHWRAHELSLGTAESEITFQTAPTNRYILRFAAKPAEPNVVELSLNNERRPSSLSSILLSSRDEFTKVSREQYREEFLSR